MSEKLFLIVEDLEEETRLDAYIAESLCQFSRSKAKELITNGKVTLNGKLQKPSKTVSDGDEIYVTVDEPEIADILPEDVPFDIVYEDDDFAIINKPQGVIVHPTATMRTGTLVNGLMKRLQNLSGINGVLRPGIVHRIDKDTSGLLVVAKNDLSHKNLAEQIQKKEARRSYLALNEGVIKDDSGVIETFIGRNPKDRKSMAVVKEGRWAVTHFAVLERFCSATFTRFDLETGRTHQIRVHSKYIGHPIIGDPVYGFSKQRFKLNGQLLHAETLVLTHPRTGERMEFHAPLPDYFLDVLDKLRKE